MAEKSFESITAKFMEPGANPNDVWRELQGFWASQGCQSEVAFCQARLEGKGLGEAVDRCIAVDQQGPGMRGAVDVPVLGL